MKRWGLRAVALLVMGMAMARAATPPGLEKEPLRVVVHMNFAETGRQGHGLNNIANVLKATERACEVEVVCHGAGIGLVEANRSEHAEQVETLIKNGVRFVACENTMRHNAIRKEDLLPGVGTVPSGTVEVVQKQQYDGFAYFKP